MVINLNSRRHRIAACAPRGLEDLQLTRPASYPQGFAVSSTRLLSMLLRDRHARQYTLPSLCQSNLSMFLLRPRFSKSLLFQSTFRFCTFNLGFETIWTRA